MAGDVTESGGEIFAAFGKQSKCCEILYLVDMVAYKELERKELR